MPKVDWKDEKVIPLDAREDGMYRCFVGQAANVDPNIRVQYARQHGAFLVILRLGSVMRRVLCIDEDNVEMRFADYDRKWNATWRFSGDPDTVGVDAVAVFYGEASREGALWDESKGNKKKDNYRRLSYTDDVSQYEAVPGLWNEIERTHLSEENLRRLLIGEPLEERSYA